MIYLKLYLCLFIYSFIYIYIYIYIFKWSIYEYVVKDGKNKFTPKLVIGIYNWGSTGETFI